ncbi:MAG TPA: hypothetical protein VFQ61_36175, partial [Polyangiaceae bacterium]|nr:hypothetical protein [Polyangiaceae bacterium]
TPHRDGLPLVGMPTLANDACALVSCHQRARAHDDVRGCVLGLHACGVRRRAATTACDDGVRPRVLRGNLGGADY